MKMRNEKAIATDFYIMASVGGELFRLRKIIVRGKDLYVPSSGQSTRVNQIDWKVNGDETQTLKFSDIQNRDTADFANTYDQMKLSVHQSGIAHHKDKKDKYHSRDWTRLLHPQRITDFYFFSPKAPFKEKGQPRHFKKPHLVINLQNFIVGKHSLICKLGIGSKTITHAAEEEYSKLNHITLKIEFQEFNLYLSIQIESNFRHEGISGFFHEVVGGPASNVSP